MTERFTPSAAYPRYDIGEEVEYLDDQDRHQHGKVSRIEAHWTWHSDALLIYTVSHPTYRNKRMYVNEKRIIAHVGESR